MGLAMDQMRVNAKVDTITNGRSDTLPSPTYSGESRIFARGVRQLVPLECPKPLHALSPSDR